MKQGLLLMAVAMLYSMASLAIDIPEGRLVDYRIKQCDASICEPCYFIEPSFDYPCSDQFGAVDFTDFRSSLGLPSFKAQCIRHDSCYHVLGNTKAQCDADFSTRLSKSCEDTYISAVPDYMKGLLDSSIVKESARRVVYEVYNEMLGELSGTSGGTYQPMFNITNPFEGTPLEDPLDDLGETVRNPFDGTILDDEKFDELGDSLADLEDAIRALVDDVNLAKYYMCEIAAEIMVTAVGSGIESLNGFENYQQDAIALVLDQTQNHSCPISDLQVVDAQDAFSLKNIVTGLYDSYGLSVSDQRLNQYLSVWEVYGNVAVSEAAIDARNTYISVLLIPGFTLLNN